MTYSDSRIAILLLHHELGHRFAHNVRATQNDALLTAGLDVVAFQQRNDAQRRSRDEARQANSHTTHIDGMETVYILAIVDSFDDLLFVDMLGQRKLHDKAINIIVLIELIDTSQNSP